MLCKAITTTFFGPSGVRGSRIRAKAPDVASKFFEYDHALRHDQRHAAVAKQYAESLGWSGLYVGGTTDNAHVWVNMGSEIPASLLPVIAGQMTLFGIEGTDFFYVEEKAR